MSDLPVNRIIQGDCREVLRTLPDESVHCCITSPPYWGLRVYGTDGMVWGGDETCEHEWEYAPMKLTHDNRNFQRGTQDECLDDAKGTTHIMSRTKARMGSCAKCGAWLGELGLEPTPEMYVEHLVMVFREVKRVLRGDGTLWLNLGDGYAASSNTGGTNSIQGSAKRIGAMTDMKHGVPPGLKPKDLCGIPWRVAFALQADGWWLRQDIIWHKPNPMPESVTDRCTKAHEYVFLLTKSARYYYDTEAIKEHAKYPGQGGAAIGHVTHNQPGSRRLDEESYKTCRGENRNKRSVWTVTTKPFSEAHFATFPPDLIKPMVLAGCPVDGIVLDPFMGSGTTALVARENARNYIGIELNPEYRAMAGKRLEKWKGQRRLI